MVLSEVEAQAHHKWEGIKGRVKGIITNVDFDLTRFLKDEWLQFSNPCLPLIRGPIHLISLLGWK
jgi:hypothetical protein